MRFHLLIVLHLLLGLCVDYAPFVVSFYCILVLCIGLYQVVRTRDENHAAGYYALYLMGMEIPYRMGKFVLAYEMGKYLCIIVLLAGVIFGLRKRIPFVFIFLLLLLIPAIFLSDGPDVAEIRKMVMFNISGPLSLVIAGLYFYARPISLGTHLEGLRMGFLPAITTIVGLSLKSGLGTIDFSSISSNAAASGGWGANQVSTAMGWFVLLFFLLKIKNQKIFPFIWMDYVFLFILILRGLLTFSRGGMMGAAIAIALVSVVAILYDGSFRRNLVKRIPYVVFGLLFAIGAAFYANQLTNNFLLYRYMGLKTNEVITGERVEEKSVLTGRDKIMEGDLAAFQDYPLLGVGYGMAVEYHARFYGSVMAAHTEFTRLLSENGLLGILFNVIAFLLLPISFWFFSPPMESRYFFVAFFILSLLVMFHSAMRLALPGVLYGIAFARIYAVTTQKS